jgi:hypothetical protein
VKFEPIADMIFLMTHGIYWLPNKNFTGTVMMFLQHGGSGSFAWDEEKYFFPSPFSGLTLVPTFSEEAFVSVKSTCANAQLELLSNHQYLHSTRFRKKGCSKKRKI